MPQFSRKSESKLVVEVVYNYVPQGREVEFRALQKIPSARLSTMLGQIRLQPVGEYEQPGHAALRLLVAMSAHEAGV